MAAQSLQTLLSDAQRPARFTLEAGALQADFSRQKIDSEVITRLCDWARASGFEQDREDLFAGRIVNPTEDRPALHPALRGVCGAPALTAEIEAQHDETAALATRLREGALKGFRGTPLRALVCLGIGGSDLGPRLVVDALKEADAFDVRFVANVDPDELARELIGLNPETTAFALISKTFTTRETLANADAARRWLIAGGCPSEVVAEHLIGVSAAVEATRAQGIRPDRLLSFHEGVGGRYSLWSAVGLGIAVACGPAVHAALRAGAAEIDRHFRDHPLESNLPAWVGLISVWNRAFLGMPTQALVPYSERLRLLPAWAQQLVMESNGKSVQRDGHPVTLPTAPVYWGSSGTPAQHSYFQQLHQGPDRVPVDFILAAQSSSTPGSPTDDRQRILLANGLAQAAALALGRAAPEGDPHRHFPGDRPSTVFMLKRVEARSLGALLAVYEHATFTAACVLGINPFDQFGVEYGKVLASDIERLLAGTPVTGLDPATLASAQRLTALR